MHACLTEINIQIRTSSEESSQTYSRTRNERDEREWLARIHPRDKREREIEDE